MELNASAWQLITSALVLLVGAAVAVAVGRRLECSSGRSLALYGWHTLFCVFYCLYALRYGADALGYYRNSFVLEGPFAPGTTGVRYLTSLMTQGLGLSLIGTFLVYNVFGSIGLLAFDGCLRVATRDKAAYIRRLATLIVFLPSVSFWSSAIGKDAPAFMAVGLALWASLDLGRRPLLMAFAVALMLLVRPHMAGLMVMGLTVAPLLDPKTTPGKKLLLGTVAAAVAAAMVPFALHYAGVGDNVSADSLKSYVESRQAQNMAGGGSVDIASMSLPMQLFTYLFRPLLIEARSPFALAAAIDNLILLYLFAAGGYAILQNPARKQRENRVFLWSYALMAWLVLSMTTANLGIALRQKWMFAPMLIFLLLSAIGRPRQAQLEPGMTPVMKIYQTYGLLPGQRRRP